MNRLSIIFLVIFATSYVSAHGTGDDHDAEIAFRPVAPVVGEPTTIDIMLRNASDEPVLSLDVTHGSAMHVFIIGSDLTTFAHVHPEDIKDGFSFQWIGAYSVRTTFPAAGKYLIAAEYTYQNISHQAVFPVEINGSKKMPVMTEDYSRSKTYGTLNVKLDAPKNIVSIKNTELTYEITNDQQPITELGEYLGSRAHFIVMRSDMTNVQHAHSGHDASSDSHSQKPELNEVTTNITFSEPGTYTVFSQFNISGNIVTAQHLIKVGEPRSNSTSTVIIIAIIIVLAAIGIKQYLKKE